jgi:hypothetical protein
MAAGETASRLNRRRGDLWITEFILTYDGKPSSTLSIMESGTTRLRETQYFADPFAAPAWRAQWVERMDT